MSNFELILQDILYMTHYFFSIKRTYLVALYSFIQNKKKLEKKNRQIRIKILISYKGSKDVYYPYSSYYRSLGCHFWY